MSWPLPQDFNEAVQHPVFAFADDDLKAAKPVVGPTGLPLPHSGNFADVYQLRGPDGRAWAVKCFTREVTGLGERYEVIARELAAAKLPVTVPFTFLPQGVKVRGAWFPAVKMEWVEGLQLNQVARDAADKPAVLDALVRVWARLAARLREAKVAHADLQCGNVLLIPGSKPGTYGLKLIDYDGVYVPALANRPSGEVGHPAFQHPDRAAKRIHSPDLDRFAHLVVATALKGLACCGPALWEKYDAGDNLLFTADDFAAPAASPLVRTLWDSGFPEVRALVGRLVLACGRPLPQTPWLDEIVTDGTPTPLAAGEERAVARVLAGEAAAAPAVAAAVPADESFGELAERPVAASRRAPRSSPLVPVGVAAVVLLAVGAAVGVMAAFGGKKAADTAGPPAADDRKAAPEKERPKSPPEEPKSEQKEPAPPRPVPAPVAVDPPDDPVEPKPKATEPDLKPKSIEPDP